MRKIRLVILIGFTVIFGVLLDIYIAIAKSTTFGVNPDNWKLDNLGVTFSIIILVGWYIYEIRLFFKERREKHETK